MAASLGYCRIQVSTITRNCAECKTEIEPGSTTVQFYQKFGSRKFTTTIHWACLLFFTNRKFHEKKSASAWERKVVMSPERKKMLNRRNHLIRRFLKTEDEGIRQIIRVELRELASQIGEMRLDKAVRRSSADKQRMFEEF